MFASLGKVEAKEKWIRGSVADLSSGVPDRRTTEAPTARVSRASGQKRASTSGGSGGGRSHRQGGTHTRKRIAVERREKTGQEPTTADVVSEDEVRNMVFQ